MRVENKRLINLQHFSPKQMICACISGLYFSPWTNQKSKLFVISNVMFRSVGLSQWTRSVVPYGRPDGRGV